MSDAKTTTRLRCEHDETLRAFLVRRERELVMQCSAIVGEIVRKESELKLIRESLARNA